MLLVSVAYPEENLLFGDNIHHAEAALLWMKNYAEATLGIKFNRHGEIQTRIGLLPSFRKSPLRISIVRVGAVIESVKRSKGGCKGAIVLIAGYHSIGDTE